MSHLPTRCRYVSLFLGKSKLMTTLTAWMSIPRVNRSACHTQPVSKYLASTLDTRVRAGSIWIWHCTAHV